MVTLPERFTDLFKESLGNEIFSRFLESFIIQPPVSIRFSQKREAVSGNLIDKSVPWCKEGFYLKERPGFTNDPLFHSGVYYVQEASSMFLEQVWLFIKREIKGSSLKLLDLCAAPGGKSTHLLSLASPEDLVVCNEVIGKRATILAENISKWGCPNVVVSSSDPKDFSSIRGYFDFVVADLPCSGEGMFRRERDVMKEWSIDNVIFCAERQRRIVGDIWDSLVEGGYMLYSTCTFNKYENDDNVKWICSELGAEVVEIVDDELAQEWGIIRSNAGGYHFVPGVAEGEGFYCALLRKRSESGKDKISGKTDKNKISIKLIEKLSSCLNGDFDLFMKGELVKAYPSHLSDEMRWIESRLKVIMSGVAVADILKGEIIIPCHDLILSNNYCRGAYPEVDVDIETALKYLSKDTIQPLTNMARGYVLLTYQNIPIGFVKNIGNRHNNLLPPNRRIRF